MDKEGMIQLPSGVDLIAFVKKVYALSAPQGMGMLHFMPGVLDDSVAREIVDKDAGIGRIAVSMDYVHGRACKMVVFRDTDNLSLWIRGKWYDHTAAQLKELLGEFGVEFDISGDVFPHGWGTAG